MRLIKQLGLQRSGTNALKALIELNFTDVVVLANYLGNKHEATSWRGMVEAYHEQDVSAFKISGLTSNSVKRLLDVKRLPVVICVKEPVSWVNSYYKYQKRKVQHNNPEARFPFNLEWAKKVQRTWENNVLSWLSFHSDHPYSLVFSHTEIVTGLKNSRLEQIKSKFRLDASRQYPLGLIDGYMRRGTDLQHGEELVNEKMEFDREYHLGEEWRKDIPGDVLRYLEDYSDRFFREYPQYAKYFY